MNIASSETGRAPRARPARGRRSRPGARPLCSATAAAADGGRRGAPAVGGRDAARAAGRPVRGLGIERVHVLTRPAWRRRSRAGRRRAALHAAGERRRRPARDRRIAAGARRPAGRRLRRHRHPARGARRPAGRAADRAPACSSPAAPRGAPLRLQDARAGRGRIVSARLALPRRAPPHRHVPRRAQGRARRPRPASPRSPSGSPRWSSRRRPPTGRRSSTTSAALAPRCSRCSRWTRERGAPAPTREALDAAALSPEDAAELERRRAIAPDDITALLLVGLVRSGVHVSASRLRSLFWARPLSPAGARARRRGDRSSTTRTASCSTPRSRARTASSRPSSSRPTRSTSRAGRRGAG